MLWCLFKDTYQEDPTPMTSSRPNCLPKAPPPKAITLEVRASVYGFQGDIVMDLHGKSLSYTAWTTYTVCS